MSPTIPTVAEVRRALEKLSHAKVKHLAETTQVPFSTLWKIRTGETTNPGIETVSKFWLPCMALACEEGSAGRPSITSNEEKAA
jgi:predicted transcriptional regulator